MTVVQGNGVTGATAGAMAEETVVGADGAPEAAGAADALGTVRRLIRTGADALIEAAADERTGEALDRAAGSDWRWTARAGSLVAAAARVVTGDPSKPTTDAEAGEPLAVERPEKR